jgi:hypothetical protein
MVREYQRIKSAVQFDAVTESQFPRVGNVHELFVATDGTDVQIYDAETHRYTHVASETTVHQARLDVVRALQAYYSFEKASSGTSHIQNDIQITDGSIQNASNVSVADNGRVGSQSMAFQAGGYIDIKDVVHVGSSAFTVMVWIKNASGIILRSSPTSANSSQYWSLQVDDSDPDNVQATFETKDNTDTTGAVTAVLSSFDEWVFLAATRDGSSLELYVNHNKPVSSSGGGTGTVHDINESGVISDPDAGITNDAQVDEVGIWSRKLSQDEIWFLYNAGNGRHDFLDTQWYDLPAQTDVRLKQNRLRDLGEPVQPSDGATKAYVDSEQSHISVFVAAQNAPQYVRNKASFVCNGVDDHIQIQNALDQANTTSATQEVILSAGTFILGNSITVHANQLLQGRRSELKIDSGVTTKIPVVIATEDKITLREIVVNGNKNRFSGDVYNDAGDGVRLASTFGLLEHVQVKNCVGEGIEVPSVAKNLVLHNCRVAHCAGSGFRFDDPGITVTLTTCTSAKNGHAHQNADTAGFRLHARRVHMSECNDTDSYTGYVFEPNGGDDDRISLTNCHGTQLHNDRPVATAGISDLWTGIVTMTNCVWYQNSADGGPIALFDAIGTNGQLWLNSCGLYANPSSTSPSYTGLALWIGGGYNNISVTNCNFRNRNTSGECVVVRDSSTDTVECTFSGIRVDQGKFRNRLQTSSNENSERIVLLTGSILWNIQDDTGTLVMGASHNRNKS